MDSEVVRIVSSFLFAGALTALGCEVLPTNPDDEALDHEAEQLAGIDELADEIEARSGGGGDGGQPSEVTCEPIELWPPNHAYETIDLEDCIADLVSDGWWPKIEWVSSDEEENGRGDGDTTDDILCVDTDTVKVRRERQDGGDGRVYTIWFEAEDDHGNEDQHSCRVIVPHDRGRGAVVVDSGEMYEVFC